MQQKLRNRGWCGSLTRTTPWSSGAGAVKPRSVGPPRVKKSKLVSDIQLSELKPECKTGSSTAPSSITYARKKRTKAFSFEISRSDSGNCLVGFFEAFLGFCFTCVAFALLQSVTARAWVEKHTNRNGNPGYFGRHNSAPTNKVPTRAAAISLRSCAASASARLSLSSTSSFGLSLPRVAAGRLPGRCCCGQE